MSVKWKKTILIRPPFARDMFNQVAVVAILTSAIRLAQTPKPDTRETSFELVCNYDMRSCKFTTEP